MKKGILLAFLTAVISGFSIFFAKISVAVTDPVVFTTLKNLLVAVILTAFLYSGRKMALLKKLSAPDWGKLFAIGVIGGGLPFALFFTGLKEIPAINGALIHKTLFIWVALLAIIFLREKITFKQMLGYVLILWANWWLGSFKNFHFGRGELLVLFATLLWAVENVLAKKALKNIPFEIVAWARMSIGAVVLLLVLIGQSKTNLLFDLNSTQLITTLISSGLLVGYVLCWYRALSLAPATLVAAILVFSTIITNLLSRNLDFTSTFLLLAGLALITLFEKKLWTTKA